MIRPHVPAALRYVDYGKVFVPNGALDFGTLAYSDEEVARFGPTLFNRGLLFPEGSDFAAQIGGVSAALLMFEGGYLFTLVQRRREGELSEPGSARTDRPFNQVRFVILNRETIEQAFSARTALYSGLALAARDPNARVWLKDHTAGDEKRPWSPQFQRVDPQAPDPEAVRFVADALVSAAARAGEVQPISVALPAGRFGLVEKLQLVEAVQYWTLPRLGVLSFALDYVSIQNVHLRLFRLPPDAPAPLPADRVFSLPHGSGPAAPPQVDYHGAVSSLEHEVLYDEALPGLLGLRITPAEAVRLLRVEKQAEPLPGADALRLHAELSGLGERRLGLLRRVPRADVLALLGQADLPVDLRLDLLRIAFQAAHGQLVLYAPVHLAVPRAQREDERVRELLRASVTRSPDVSLDVWSADDQRELFRELLLARRPAAVKSAAPAAGGLALATGQPLLEVLILTRRGPALARALQDASAADPALFGEALEIVDRAADLKGLLWLWRNAGRRDPQSYAALLERAVQPGWYASLVRESGAWRDLLAEGRRLAAGGEPESGAADAEGETGSLLRALPRPLFPFVWQASLAVAEHDAAFAEWWLFNEALALPDQLPALWEAIQRLPAAALEKASPRLRYLLGRGTGLSLLQACTPPSEAEANEALYAAVLRGWLAAGFRAPGGSLSLATEDLLFLIDHLPESNDILAAIAVSPAQASAVQGLSAERALRWAQAASGERRQPYRQAGRDGLVELLIELPALDEALAWHLLVEDAGTAGLPWAQYAALAARCREKAEAWRLPSDSRLGAYLETAGALQNAAAADTLKQSQIDVRRILVRLAAPPDEPASLADSLLPLAAIHLQETHPRLRERAAEILRAGLQQPDVQAYLKDLPDSVLEYLRENICAGQPALAAAGHWIEAELARRHDAYRPRPAVKAPASRVIMTRTPQTAAVAATAAQQPAAAPPLPAQASPAPAPAAEAGAGVPEPLLGQMALPGAPPKKADTAVWLWIAIVVIGLVTCAILAAAAFWLQSLSSAGPSSGSLVWYTGATIVGFA